MALWRSVIRRVALLCALTVLAVAAAQSLPAQVGEAQQISGTGTPIAMPAQTTTAATPAASSVVADATPQATVTAIATRLLTLTATPARTPSRTPTATATATATRTLTPTATQTTTRAPTATLTPTAAPTQIMGITSSSLTRSSATITWTTSQPANSQVTYGAAGPDAFRSPIDPPLVTAHRVVLTGLLPGTPYQFTVRSATAAGALAVSTINSLTTAPAGSGPDVVSLSARQATGTLATLSWATSTGTVAQVEYGTNANYGLFTLLRVFTAPTQQMTVTGLRPATTYHYRVKAWDAQGALGASADATFTTAPAGLATLVGDDTVQTEPLSLPGGQAAAYQYVASQSGQASVVRVYVDVGSLAPAVRVALYSDQDGAPGMILSQGSAPALIPGWTSVSVSPVPLLEGTRYWLGVLNPLGGGTLSLRHARSGGSSQASAQSSLAAFPQPWVPGTGGARSPLSAYVQQVPPAVTLTGPGEGSIVTGPTLLSAVIDDDAPLTRVQFYVDGLPVGPALTSAPFSVRWNPAGFRALVPHTLTARATDALGRSGDSGATTVQVDNGPAIAAVSVGPGLTASSARITWLTDLPADSQVEYGLTAAYGLSTPPDAQLASRHEVELTGLTSGAEYHYRVRSRDTNGALAVSADATFFTSAP